MPKKWVIFSIFVFFSQNYLSSTTYVTYELSNGRFGDQLLCYMHAKWIAYKYGLTLLYKPFIFSQHLILHRLEEPYDGKHFNKEISYTQGMQFIHHGGESVLYVLPYFPECPYERIVMGWHSFSIDWEDEGFRAELKKMISPTENVDLSGFPHHEEEITIALHIRSRRTLEDHPESYVYWPLKFPPPEYYLQSLRKAQEQFPEKRLRVCLFTDDPYPQELVNFYQAQLPNCIFGRREKSFNTIEDFFFMKEFDCLISSSSNYTFSLPRISDYKMSMRPGHFGGWDLQQYVDRLDIIMR